MSDNASLVSSIEGSGSCERSFEVSADVRERVCAIVKRLEQSKADATWSITGTDSGVLSAAKGSTSLRMSDGSTSNVERSAGYERASCSRERKRLCGVRELIYRSGFR